MQFPIHIELRRSRLLSILHLLFHALAAGCVLVLPLHWTFHGLLLILLGMSAWRTQRPPEILGLRLSERTGLDCLLPGGERIAAQLLPDSTVFGLLVVLRLRIGEAARISNFALLPDSMSVEHFRLLRLWLRWQISENAVKHV